MLKFAAVVCAISVSRVNGQFEDLTGWLVGLSILSCQYCLTELLQNCHNSRVLSNTHKYAAERAVCTDIGASFISVEFCDNLPRSRPSRPRRLDVGVFTACLTPDETNSYMDDLLSCFVVKFAEMADGIQPTDSYKQFTSHELINPQLRRYN